MNGEKKFHYKFFFFTFEDVRCRNSMGITLQGVDYNDGIYGNVF